MIQPDVQFLDIVYDITLMKECDIDYLKIPSSERYDVVDMIEFIFTDTYKLIDKKIVKFEILEDLIFDAKSSMNYIKNNITQEQLTNVHIKIVAKLTEIEVEAANFEYFETAQNYNNYTSMFIQMFTKQIDFI